MQTMGGFSMMLTSRSSYRLVRCHGPTGKSCRLHQKVGREWHVGIGPLLWPTDLPGLWLRSQHEPFARSFDNCKWRGCRGYQNKSIASGMSGERREVGDSSWRLAPRRRVVWLWHAELQSVHSSCFDCIICSRFVRRHIFLIVEFSTRRRVWRPLLRRSLLPYAGEGSMSAFLAGRVTPISCFWSLSRVSVSHVAALAAM